MADLVYKQLSYDIMGVLFKVYNKLGGGYQEKYYQKAITLELKKLGISFKEQIPVSLDYDGENIGRYFLDFLIDNKIILEIKVAPEFYHRDIEQLLGYLKATNLPLGILASFNKKGLKYKRILKGKN